MKVFQSSSFGRKIKKFRKKEKEELDKAVKKIVSDPDIGTEKKGDLKGIFVYKFKINNIEHLLAYRIVDDAIELIAIGTHENYYRDLKGYLKKR